MSVTRHAAKSILRSSLCFQCRRNLATRTFSHIPLQSRPNASKPVLRYPIVTVRKHSAPPSNSKVYDFKQVKAITESPSADRVLIDVREPAEYAQGFIPTALNMPIKTQPDGLFLPDEEFEDRFGFEKPGKDKEVVFYCRSGVRSSAAAQLAQQGGYTNVAEYRGSWLDWEKNGGSGSQA